MGNLTHDGIFTYNYHTAGRLVRAESVTNTLIYTTNGDGVRVAMAADGQVVEYVLDPISLAQVLIEISGTERITYTYGLARLWQDKGEGEEWFLGDALGSVEWTD